MESKRPTSEGSAGVCDATSSDDHQQVQSQAIRSYECSFCKKGFSNAQALGGHMNIHRKDKAKLKKAAAAARLPAPDSSRSVLSASSRITHKVKSLEFTSRQILGKDLKWSDIFRQQEVSSFPRNLRNESQMAETMMIQFPLFVETTANRVVDYSKPLGQQVISTNWQQQMLLHSTNGGGAGGGGGSSSMSAGLDLELRLGQYSPSSSPLPPPESSTVTTGSFLKFF